jgi:nicotinate-nucleotide pyrophosphorylase
VEEGDLASGLLASLERETARVLGAAALIKSFLDKIGVSEIVNSYVKDGSEISHGEIIEILDQPSGGARALYHIERWAQGTAIEEFYGLGAEN